MKEFKLTDEQQHVVDSIKEFLKGEEEIYTLIGVAGSGKTTCIKEALHGESDVVGATVAHSAKDVLSEALGGYIPCVTVAQLLGLKQNIDEDGNIKFIPKARTDRDGYRIDLPIDNARIILIDECSMIDKDTHDRIMRYKGAKSKIIYLGDNAQLPPVDDDEDDSISFDYIKGRLENPVRYTGPTVDLGIRIRKEIAKTRGDEAATTHILNEWMDEMGYDSRTSCVDEYGSGFIFINDIDDLIRIAIKSFEVNEHDTDNMRMIAYRNKSIKTLNEVVRANLYGENGMKASGLNQFMPGELVICNGGYKKSIYNNQTFKVVDHRKLLGPDQQECVSLLLDPLPRIDGEVYVVDYNYRQKYYNKINRMKNEAKMKSKLWVNYYRYIEQFAHFDYGYTISSHKSQGRTFTDAIIFENDIMTVTQNSLKGKLQALYVACTRAKRRVYIYNNKYGVDQSELPDNIRKELGI